MDDRESGKASSDRLRDAGSIPAVAGTAHEQRFMVVTVVIRDESDPDFWRETTGREPAERVRDYVDGLLSAGANISKFYVESTTVHEMQEAGS